VPATEYVRSWQTMPGALSRWSDSRPYSLNHNDLWELLPILRSTADLLESRHGSLLSSEKQWDSPPLSISEKQWL